MIGFVYKLVNPFDNSVVYVGSTCQKIKNRLSSHLNSIVNINTPIYSYLRLNKIVPEISIIETVSFYKKSTLLKKEKYWIRYYDNSKLQNNSPLKSIIRKVTLLRQNKVSLMKISDTVKLDYKVIRAMCSNVSMDTFISKAKKIQ